MAEARRAAEAAARKSIRSSTWFGATATLLPATTVTNGTGASATPGTGQSGSTIQIPSPSIGSTGTSGSTGTAPATPNQVPVTNPFSADSGAMSNYLPKLFANCTTSQNTSTAGRININQAPRVVLLCIPNMTSDLADQIITQRSVDPTTATDVHQCPAWPLIRGLVPLATMKKLMPYVNAGGGVFRAQVIGSFEKGGTSARVEAVIDATQSPSRIVFWKDISSLQEGFPVEPSEQDNSGNSDSNSNASANKQ